MTDERIGDISDMVDWLNDCDIDVVGLNDSDIVELVERIYDGGIRQFNLDA